MKENQIKVNSNQSGFGTSSQITEHTVDYGDRVITYTRVGVFHKSVGRSIRQLKRYRDEIVNEHPENEHCLYFHQFDGAYFYTEKMFEKMKYKTGKKEPVLISVDIDYTVKPSTPELTEQLKNKRWDFVGGVRYRNRVQIDECVTRMKKLNEELKSVYPDGKITFFYTTEPNDKSHDGFHNHVAISLSTSEPVSLNQLKEILSHAGTRVPWVEPYDSTDNYIGYMCKQIENNPDGWGLMSNAVYGDEQMNIDDLLAQICLN